MNCPCCSGKPYAECCAPFHLNQASPATAEALMRSRYCAFALPNGAYLLRTTLPAKRKYHAESDLQQWGEINQWTKLEILATPSINQVEFKAHYTDESGQPQVHHELSRFDKLNGKWYYVDGEFRN